MKETTIPEELKAGNSVMYYTVGVSMLPLLVERQTHVMLVPLTGAKKYDILLYIRKDGNLVLHRLIKMDDSFYYMRGDNTLGLERISKEQAVGVVTQIYKNGKYIDVCTDRSYKRYVKIHCLNYPFRFFVTKTKSVFKRIFRTKK